MLCGGLLYPSSADAAPREEPAASERTDRARKFPFSLFQRKKGKGRRGAKRRRGRNKPRPPPSPDGGIWEWVEELGGEIPSPDQAEAMREARADEVAEQTVGDHLGGRPPPEDFYVDPLAALTPDPLMLDQVEAADFDIPIDINPWVETWVRYFTEGRGRLSYKGWLNRSTRYQPMMLEALADAELPKDLVYLSMIESGYRPQAFSSAKAAGLWQFIESTGKEHGLRIDWWVDERRDPELSLGAAIRFLGRLHRQFGDWRLAWAAYNGGPGRIRRATANAGSDDFWTLANGDHLPSETDNYVPKIMAAAIVGRYRDRYGFDRLKPQPELRYDVVKVPYSVSLAAIARAADLSSDVLVELNPALRRRATPEGGYAVRVPVGAAETVSAALKAIPKAQRVAFARHKVRRGDTLAEIAAQYGVTVADLKGANDLRGDTIRVGARLLIPVVGERAVATAAGSQRVHVVAKGDTLSEIASTYGVSLADLLAYNDISDASRIFVGQRISLQPRVHVVVAGDSLSKIGARYGLTVEQLLASNDISDPSRIFVGQEIRLDGAQAAPDPWETYVVKPGDSLGKIAMAYDVSVADLRSWNELSGSVIHPGDQLKIKVR